MEKKPGPSFPKVLELVQYYNGNSDSTIPTSQTAQPKATRAQNIQAKTARPQTAAPHAARRESVGPRTTRPKTALPVTDRPETVQPQTTRPHKFSRGFNTGWLLEKILATEDKKEQDKRYSLFSRTTRSHGEMRQPISHRNLNVSINKSPLLKSALKRVSAYTVPHQGKRNPPNRKTVSFNELELEAKKNHLVTTVHSSDVSLQKAEQKRLPGGSGSTIGLSRSRPRSCGADRAMETVRKQVNNDKTLTPRATAVTSRLNTPKPVHIAQVNTGGYQARQVMSCIDHVREANFSNKKSTKRTKSAASSFGSPTPATRKDKAIVNGAGISTSDVQKGSPRKDVDRTRTLEGTGLKNDITHSFGSQRKSISAASHCKSSSDVTHGKTADCIVKGKTASTDSRYIKSKAETTLANTKTNAAKATAEDDTPWTTNTSQATKPKICTPRYTKMKTSATEPQNTSEEIKTAKLAANGVKVQLANNSMTSAKTKASNSNSQDGLVRSSSTVSQVPRGNTTLSARGNKMSNVSTTSYGSSPIKTTHPKLQDAKPPLSSLLNIQMKIASKISQDARVKSADSILDDVKRQATNGTPQSTDRIDAANLNSGDAKLEHPDLMLRGAKMKFVNITPQDAKYAQNSNRALHVTKAKARLPTLHKLKVKSTNAPTKDMELKTENRKSHHAISGIKSTTATDVIAKASTCNPTSQNTKIKRVKSRPTRSKSPSPTRLRDSPRKQKHKVTGAHGQATLKKPAQSSKVKQKSKLSIHMPKPARIPSWVKHKPKARSPRPSPRSKRLKSATMKTKANRRIKTSRVNKRALRHQIDEPKTALQKDDDNNDDDADDEEEDQMKDVDEDEKEEDKKEDQTDENDEEEDEEARSDFAMITDSYYDFDLYISDAQYAASDGSDTSSDHPYLVEQPATELEDTKASLRAADRILQQLDARFDYGDTRLDQGNTQIILGEKYKSTHSCQPNQQIESPDGLPGHGTADELGMNLAEDTTHLQGFKDLLSQTKILTYKRLRKVSKVSLPEKLPVFETSSEEIRRLHREITFVMRPHEHEVFNVEYPKMVMPHHMDLVMHNSQPIVTGSGDYGLTVLVQSSSTKALYAVKYYTKGAGLHVDCLRDIIREAAVQQAACRLLPGMVPRVKGFVAVSDISGTFVPVGLVTEFVPMVEGSLNTLPLSKAMSMQKSGSAVFATEVWLDMAEQLIRGFRVLSDNAITHNAVSANTILLAVSHSHISPVISDFGEAMCREQDAGLQHHRRSVPSQSQIPDLLSHFIQLAPEATTRRKANNSRNSDVYGVGTILKELGSMLTIPRLMHLGDELMEKDIETRIHWSTVQKLMQNVIQPSVETKHPWKISLHLGEKIVSCLSQSKSNNMITVF